MDLVQVGSGSRWWLGFWPSSAWVYWWAVEQPVDPTVPAQPQSGRIDRAVLDPILDELAAALPRPVDDLSVEITLCERLIEDLTRGPHGVDVSKRAADLADQIEVRERLRQTRVRHNADAVARAWRGPLVDPAANVDLCTRLGDLLVPPPLRDALSTDPDPVVVIAPGPALAVVPWELLVIDSDGTRMLERATLLTGLSPVHLLDLPSPVGRRPRGVLRIVDPTGRTGHDARSSIYPEGVPDLWAQRSADEFDRCSDRSRGCGADELSEWLREHPRRLLYLGHVTSDSAGVATRSALELAADTTGSGRLTAHAWLSAPERWPAPHRVALLACRSDDAGFEEQAGLTLAAVRAGGRLVTTTRWSLPTDGSESLVARAHDEPRRPTTELAVSVDDAHGTDDPTAALRAYQLDQYHRWRAATDDDARRAHSPLLWASLCTYAVPEQALDWVSGDVAAAARDRGAPRDREARPSSPPASTLAEAHHMLRAGNTAFRAGDWARADDCYSAALPFFSAAGDEQAMADTITNLGNVAWRRGRFDEAEARYADALDRYAHLGSAWQVAVVVQNRGNVAYHRGNLDRARADYQEAADRLTALGEHRRAADARVNLSAFFIELGQPDAALDELDVAAELYRDHGSPDELPRLRAELGQNRGLALADAGRLDAGRVELERALAAYAVMDDAEKAAELEHDIALCAARQGDLESAALGYGRALSYYERVQDELAAADCHLGLGTIALRQDRLPDAERNARTALTTYRAAQRWAAAATAEHNLGQALPGESGLAHLVNAWAELQAMYWRLPDLTERASWRRTIAMATESVLDAAHAQNRADLVAEIIESSRVAGIVRLEAEPLPPAHQVGDKASGQARNDLPELSTAPDPDPQVLGSAVPWTPRRAADRLPCTAPPLIDCGWPPVLAPLASRPGPGAHSDSVLRRGRVSLAALLPERHHHPRVGRAGT